MSAKNLKTSSIKVIAKRLKALPERAIDYSDIPPLSDDFFKTARLLMPQPKKPVAIRLDEDVLIWFQKQGAGYQSRINAVLRAYMATEQRGGK